LQQREEIGLVAPLGFLHVNWIGFFCRKNPRHQHQDPAQAPAPSDHIARDAWRRGTGRRNNRDIPRSVPMVDAPVRTSRTRPELSIAEKQADWALMARARPTACPATAHSRRLHRLVSIAACPSIQPQPAPILRKASSTARGTCTGGEHHSVASDLVRDHRTVHRLGNEKQRHDDKPARSPQTSPVASSISCTTKTRKLPPRNQCARHTAVLWVSATVFARVFGAAAPSLQRRVLKSLIGTIAARCRCRWYIEDQIAALLAITQQHLPRMSYRPKAGHIFEMALHAA